jgi:hypothetical protein
MQIKKEFEGPNKRKKEHKWKKHHDKISLKTQ